LYNYPSKFTNDADNKHLSVKM